MKHLVKHACGHEQVHKLYGSRKEREWKIVRLSAQLCAECEKKAQEEKNKKSAKENAEAGLPLLMGTEKQIAWAETIRAEKVKELLALKEELSECVYPEMRDKLPIIFEVIDARISETSSAVWIDERDVKLDAEWLGRNQDLRAKLTS